MGSLNPNVIHINQKIRLQLEKDRAMDPNPAMLGKKNFKKSLDIKLVKYLCLYIDSSSDIFALFN